MKRILLLIIVSIVCSTGFAQKYNLDSSLTSLRTKKDSTLKALKFQRDSSYKALIHEDSVKANKDFTEAEKWEKIKGMAIYPAIKGGENSGVIPMDSLTEIPDPTMEYKLLFELVNNNPDSLAKDINFGLTEISRVINLHAASGIPVKKIKPVIVVHAAALKAITTNEYYKEQYKIDNPNIKVINELKGLGAKFIACGQAMHFFDVKKEALLADVKISLTAQTVLSNYQLKGYVKYYY